MISVPEVVVERVAAAIGSGESLADLAARSARAVDAEGVVAVIAATFSNSERFPSLAVRVAASLGLPSSVAAFDVQMACSAYPYALYLAGRLSSDMGGKVLVIDGDVQSPLVDENDHATGKIFSDACTATVVSSNPGDASRFDFFSRQDEALACGSQGPIKMDGFQGLFLRRHGSVQVSQGFPLVFSCARLLRAASGESVHGATACRRAWIEGKTLDDSRGAQEPWLVFSAACACLQRRAPCWFERSRLGFWRWIFRVGGNGKDRWRLRRQGPLSRFANQKDVLTFPPLRPNFWYNMA